MLNKMYYY